MAAQPAVAAPPAVARLLAAAADTNITRGHAAVSSRDPDEWAISRDSPVVSSIKFIPWDIPAAAGRNASAAMSEIQGLCIAACSFDMSNGDVLRALRAANLMESALSRTCCSAILHELHEARIFEAEYSTEAELFDAIQGNPLINKQQLAFSPGWVATLDPFDTPGQAVAGAAHGRRGAAVAQAAAANPPVAGPDSLKFLQLTSWEAILRESQAQVPGQGPRVLARIITLLSHRSRDATRRDAASDIQAAAATLTTYVSKHM